jgi:hypothetical protein
MIRYEQWVNRLVRHEQMEREFFIESPIPHPSAMIRRELLERLGGYRDRGWPEDYDLWFRCLECGARFEKVERPLLRWRDRPDRLSRVDARYSADSFLRLKAHFLARRLRASAPRGVLVWGAGPIGRRLSRHLANEGVSIEGFVDIDPRKIGRTRRGVSVFSPEVLEETRGIRVLAAVGAPGGRERIRAHLDGLGYDEGTDYLCVA